MRLYLIRKLGVYCVTFVAAVTLNWAIPHLIPGNPIARMIQERFRTQPDQAPYELIFHTFGRAFRADLPLWKQYYYYWYSLLHADLGISITIFPRSVFHVIALAAPYTLGLLIPAIVLSWYAGNKVGAMAAHRKVLDNTLLPVSYVLAASPYMWIATIISWLFAFVLRVFPGSFGYSPTVMEQWSWAFTLNLLYHWFLPFFSLFLVSFGAWAIGMRTAIVSELDADYARYLRSLGAPRRLVRKHTSRNAMLPQLTGLAIQLGAIMAGTVVTEIVFAYPGVGYLLYRALITYDYFLVQGIFLFIIIGVLLLNFIVDIVCVVVDPRTRIGMQGGQA